MLLHGNVVRLDLHRMVDGRHEASCCHPASCGGAVTPPTPRAAEMCISWCSSRRGAVGCPPTTSAECSACALWTMCLRQRWQHTPGQRRGARISASRTQHRDRPPAKGRVQPAASRARRPHAQGKHHTCGNTYTHAAHVAPLDTATHREHTHTHTRTATHTQHHRNGPERHSTATQHLTTQHHEQPARRTTNRRRRGRQGRETRRTDRPTDGFSTEGRRGRRRQHDKRSDRCTSLRSAGRTASTFRSDAPHAPGTLGIV